MSCARLLCLLLMNLALVCAGAVVLPAGQAAGSSDPIRILLYGDSITHGSTGDWTWRYFLDRHLRSGQVAFDFVGPRSGLHHVPEPVTGPNPDDTDYADPDFDRDSAAVWGQAMSWATYELAPGAAEESLVESVRPDVVVAMIGINDMGWGGLSPQECADLLRQQIEASRTVAPESDWVLVQYPNRWFPFVADYNARLEALAEELDTPDSRVVATGAIDFEQGADTWDGTHPSSSGEVKIAAAVEQALAGIGIGEVPRSMPVVPVGPAHASSLTAYAGPDHATLAWAHVPGVLANWVEMRDLGQGESWQRLRTPFADGEFSTTVEGLLPGHRYAFRLRPAKLVALASQTSAAVEVIVGIRPDAPSLGRPSSSVRGDVAVSWAPVPSARQYAVEVTTLAGGRTRIRTEIVRAPHWQGAGWANLATVSVRVRAQDGLLVSAWSPPARVAVPALAAVRGVRGRSPRTNLYRGRAATVDGAESYQVSVATSSSCRARPRPAAFTLRKPDLARPQLTVRTRAAAVWVQWRARRGAHLGPLGPGSVRCTRVR